MVHCGRYWLAVPGSGAEDGGQDGGDGVDGLLIDKRLTPSDPLKAFLALFSFQVLFNVLRPAGKEGALWPRTEPARRVLEQQAEAKARSRRNAGSTVVLACGLLVRLAATWLRFTGRTQSNLFVVESGTLGHGGDDGGIDPWLSFLSVE